MDFCIMKKGFASEIHKEKFVWRSLIQNQLKFLC